MNIPTSIAALTNAFTVIFLPVRSVRLFALAFVAVSAAILMCTRDIDTRYWIHEGIGHLDLNDVQNAEICFLRAYEHAQKSYTGERYKEYCSHQLAEIYESVGQFEKAEKMLNEHIAIHSSSGCSHCVAEVADRRHLARVLGKQGRVNEANAIEGIDAIFEEVFAYSQGPDGLVAICSKDEFGNPIPEIFTIPRLPTSCLSHKNCEHDVEVEAREMITYELFQCNVCYELAQLPESGWFVHQRGATDDSCGLHSHKFDWVNQEMKPEK